MVVQINSDNNIVVSESFAAKVETTIAASLSHFGEQVTRVEVHMSDENGPDKSGAKDKRCMIEVRLAGHKPIVSTHEAPTIERAVDGAASKIKRQISTVLGKAGRTRVG